MSNAQRAQRFRDRHPGYNAKYRRRPNPTQVKQQIAAVLARAAEADAVLAAQAAGGVPTPPGAGA